jgi:hypothetical protein
VDVDILELDVLVLDSKQKPVPGLTKDDFEVLIARAVQPIEGFEGPPAPGAPAPPAETIAGTTVPVRADGRSTQHVLFFFDLEELPRESIRKAAEVIPPLLAGVPPPVRFSVAAQYGRSSVLAWDEAVLDRVTSQVETLEAVVSADLADSSGAVDASTPPGTARGGFVEVPRNYERRQTTERWLVESLLNAMRTGNRDSIADAWRQIGVYVDGERQRTLDLLEGMRGICRDFADLDGRKTLVFVSRGFERSPGQNFLARVDVAVKAANVTRAAGGIPPPFVDAKPNLPGSLVTSSGGVMATRLSQVDDFERWLAASGITLHFLDPYFGSDAPTAETSSGDRWRDVPAERLNLQDSPVRFADATGGLVRPGAGDMAGAVSTFLSASSGAYRLAVRMTDVDPRRSYKVVVKVKRNGLKAYSRSAYQPKVPQAQLASQVGAAAREADRGRLRSAADERRPGAGRQVLKPIVVTLNWKGKSPTTTLASGQVFYKLDVSVPYDDLKFLPEEDSMVASTRISVKADSADGKGGDTFADDFFISMTGAEYSAASGRNAVKTLTLPLAAGRWDLTVTVTDLLESRSGVTRTRVTAAP